MRGFVVLGVALIGCSREPSHVVTSRSCLELPAQTESRSNDIALALVGGTSACGATDFVIAIPAARSGARMLGAPSAAFGVDLSPDDDVEQSCETRLLEASGPEPLRESTASFLKVHQLGPREIPNDTTTVAASLFELSARLAAPMEAQEKFRFRRPDGSWAVIMTNHTVTKGLIGEVDGDKLVELPLESPTLSILFVIPKRAQRFDDARYQNWLAALHPIDVDVRIPSFRLDTTFDAMPLLASVNASSRFGSHAVALQHTRFAFDRRGINSTTSADPPGEYWKTRPTESFQADRPFFFFVHDTHQSSRFAILVAGHVQFPE